MGTQERKLRDKELRRQAILDAAKEVFFHHGFKNTSMDMIAAQSQLAKGTIYLYFKSKEDLYVSLVEDGLLLLNRMMKKTIGKANDIEEKFVQVADTYYRFSVRHKDYFQIMVAMNISDITSKVEREKLHDIRCIEQQGCDPAIEAIRQAVSAGIFRADLDPRQAVAMIWVAITGAILMPKNARESEIMKNIHPRILVQEVTRNLIRGYRK